MNVALWIVQIVLAGMFLMAGAMKLMKPKAEMKEQMPWVEDMSDATVKTIGGLEIAAAIGLILPAVTGIAPVLVALAAVGIIALMIGAASVHFRHKETQMIVVNMVLLVLAAFVAWGRFGDYAF